MKLRADEIWGMFVTIQFRICHPAAFYLIM